MLSGSLGVFSGLPPSLARAAGIAPRPGSTFMDAKRVVILMQENRSFDHMFSTYRGVRGARDPRAITLADGNPVYVQKDINGQAFSPFWMDIHGTNSTWLGATPHGRHDQVAAGNHGKHDEWVTAKGRGGMDELPMTMGYYDQRDIPFYHAFADLFTLCDQHFCSVQGPTSPNRSYFWTGTTRVPEAPDEIARVNNGQLIGADVSSWTTFPERLEDAGISWQFYQNEISQDTGLAEEEWLANYTNNNLEWFTQYRVEHYPRHIQKLQQEAQNIPAELVEIEKELAEIEGKLTNLPQPTLQAAESVIPSSETQETKEAPVPSEREILETQQGKLIARRQWKNDRKAQLDQKLAELTSANDPAPSPRERALHQKAFSSNEGDPDFRKMADVEYQHDEETQNLRVPAGDILYQFRKDTREGNLPTVSWLVAPAQFSDHPSSPWFGAWYVSEVLEILTKDPEVWKDTIFILTYDENDGFFDHVPPFVPPLTSDPETGATSEGIDTTSEFDGPNGTGVPIGLGYRVPLVMASPWSRGGYVCSEVYDHSSVLQFLEVFLAPKGKKPIHESNLSDWRRTICGDLTSSFRAHDGSEEKSLEFLERDSFIASIERAQKFELPKCDPLTEEQLADIRNNPLATQHLPVQEAGTRPSCALPYELHADGALDREEQQLRVSFECSKRFFGEDALGAPFHAYAPSGFIPSPNVTNTDDRESPEEPSYEKMRRWSFAVKAGDTISYQWPVAGFPDRKYHLELHGPNGFFREMRGDVNAQEPEIHCEYRENQQLILHLKPNRELKKAEKVAVEFLAYGDPKKVESLNPGEALEIPISLAKSACWYDFQIKIEGNDSFVRRYAGRVENGNPSITDPMIGSQG